MTKVWSTARLGDLVSSLGGLWGEAEPTDGHTQALAIRGTDFAQVRLNDLTRVPRRYVAPSALDKRRLDPSCVVIEASGGSKDQPVGRTLLIQAKHLDAAGPPLSAASFCKILRVNRELASPRFVAATLEAAYMDGTIERFQTQSTGLRNLRTKHLLSDFTIRLPDLASQARIAAVLSAFDELIEINARRVALLETIMRALYREWFVRFRFSGNKEASESGDGLPAGWRRGLLGQVAENLDRFRRPLSKIARAERRGPFPYYGAAKLIDFVDGWIFEGEHLLFAEDGTVQTSQGFPMLQLVTGQFWANNHTHILRGVELSTRFLYLAAAHYPIAGHVTGAAQPKITQANLNRIPVLIAPKRVHAMFDDLVDPLFDDIRLAKQRISRLEAVRDLLLPRLVTGRLDITDIDLGDLLPAEAA